MKVDYNVRDEVLESSIMINIGRSIWDPDGGAVGSGTESTCIWCANRVQSWYRITFKNSHKK